MHRTDARLVEVLHTNSGRVNYMNLVAGATLAAIGMVVFTDDAKEKMAYRYTNEADTAWFGIDAQLGHIEYYANNGRIQPGCEGLLHICDHKRATQVYLDSLTYSCPLCQSSSTIPDGSERSRQLAQVNRLRAFRSPNYESFATGRSFVQHCPQLMDIEAHLNDSVVLQAFDLCSVPLFDITKPLDELIDELKTRHGIELDDKSETSGSCNANVEAYTGGDTDNGQLEPRAALRKRPSFYFKTTSDEGNLVGDHFLLKIYLASKLTTSNEALCTLEARVIMSDGDRINLELRRLLYPGINQTILAMPFVYHRKCEAKNGFNNLMRLVKVVEGA